MFIGTGADVLDVLETGDLVGVIAAHDAADVAVITAVLTRPRRDVRRSRYRIHLVNGYS